MLIKKLYNDADSITCNGSDAKECLIKDFNVKKPITVIPNSYNREEILQLSKEPLDEQDVAIFENNKKTIINTSRLVKPKGQADLIKAFSLMKNREQYQLVIVGVGPYEKDLKMLTQKLGLSDEVLFIGYKKNPFKYLVRSEIFVMPSSFEGYPNSLAEALICGLAVVSYDFKAGARDLIGDDEAGKIVSIGDVEGLARAIEKAENKSQNAKIYELKDLLKAYMSIL